MTFPGSGQTAVYQNNSHLVSPRFGLPWTPDFLHGKTVIRGGFGMFVAPVIITATGVDDKFSGLQTSQNTATTIPVQLLARYPEFPVGDNSTGWSGSGGVLEQNLNNGRSYFQSVNIRL